MNHTSISTENRIIVSFRGTSSGPLFLVFGAIHGNEKAGPLAIRTVFEILETVQKKDPNFHFRGKLVGILGNRAAFLQNTRFQKQDLNRIWTSENVGKVLETNIENLTDENLEMRQLLAAIRAEIEVEQPSEIVLLDLHTTSAGGGIFIIPAEDSASLKLALKLGAPVVNGLLKGIDGAMMPFFSKENLQKYVGWQPKKRNSNAPHFELQSCAFEAGQHEDLASVSRAVAAIIYCLRAINCVKTTDLRNEHEAILVDFSKNLPSMSRLIYVHKILPDANFRMLPDFVNFQKIEKNQLLAHDRFGEIRAAESGFILMPLYQKLGSDGFFLVK
jgi:succinylglutamate desuccinylase